MPLSLPGGPDDDHDSHNTPENAAPPKKEVQNRGDSTNPIQGHPRSDEHVFFPKPFEPEVLIAACSCILTRNAQGEQVGAHRRLLGDTERWVWVLGKTLRLTNCVIFAF